MDSSAAPSIKKSRFTAFFVRENALDKRGFKEWVFSPGMLFHALDTWWGDQGRRDRPHEGLDLCQYRDQRDRMHALDEKMKVPAMYDGIVVRIVHDFLGRSVILEHVFRNSDKGRFYTMYGHTKPQGGLHVGRIVKQGDIIATLADSTRSKAGICPHLHVSLGWAPGPVSYDKLDWETIGASHTLALLDPLPLIDPASR
ncbi:MAG: M23 family metallopeptidase [Deltaproteobacteria bacterium]|nr:M23 family metallopeptidase [Deltaproteobacteria bacterium]